MQAVPRLRARWGGAWRCSSGTAPAWFGACMGAAGSPALRPGNPPAARQPPTHARTAGRGCASSTHRPVYPSPSSAISRQNSAIRRSSTMPRASDTSARHSIRGWAREATTAGTTRSASSPSSPSGGASSAISHAASSHSHIAMPLHYEIFNHPAPCHDVPAPAPPARGPPSPPACPVGQGPRACLSRLQAQGWRCHAAHAKRYNVTYEDMEGHASAIHASHGHPRSSARVRITLVLPSRAAAVAWGQPGPAQLLGCRPGMSVLGPAGPDTTLTPPAARCGWRTGSFAPPHTP